VRGGPRESVVAGGRWSHVIFKEGSLCGAHSPDLRVLLFRDFSDANRQRLSRPKLSRVLNVHADWLLAEDLMLAERRQWFYSGLHLWQ
jgi:hypothetical protein